MSPSARTADRHPIDAPGRQVVLLPAGGVLVLGLVLVLVLSPVLALVLVLVLSPVLALVLDSDSEALGRYRKHRARGLFPGPGSVTADLESGSRSAEIPCPRGWGVG